VVARKLPDAEAFHRKAAEFEGEDINSPVRRAGFARFAPEVLKLAGRKREFPAVWSADARVKNALETLSHCKCAYCESAINARRSEHVEHFKPKSLFPSLAYDWDNYFLACDGCNGTKLDKWPEQGEYVRPDEGQPEARFQFGEDGTIRTSNSDADGAQTIRDFGLDRKGLERFRSLAIQSALEDLRDLIGLGLPAERIVDLVRKQLHRLESAKTPYSVALSQNVRRVWNAVYPAFEI
jgi:uncharacterized protein (TIGR02646 family)